MSDNEMQALKLDDLRAKFTKGITKDHNEYIYVN